MQSYPSVLAMIAFDVFAAWPTPCRVEVQNMQDKHTRAPPFDGYICPSDMEEGSEAKSYNTAGDREVRAMNEAYEVTT